MEELFNKWLESKDTTENIINHLKGQKSFHLDFLKYVTEQLSIHDVSQQRELRRFVDWFNRTDKTQAILIERIDEYLNTI